MERWLSPVADLVDNYLLRIPEQLAGVGYWNEAANPGEKTLSVYAHRCKEVWEVRTHQKGGSTSRHVLASPRPFRPLLARP